MSLLVLISTVFFLQRASSITYQDLVDIYGLSARDAADLYRDRLGVSNRGGQWYGDLLSGPQTRDQEYEPNNPPLYGYKYISGGAGEGKQHLTPSGKVTNKEEVKTDKVLPAYCNPPNPCPFGYSGENCVKDFENTAENNRNYNNEQECSCDSEHMYKCPDDKKTVSAKVHGGDDENAANLGRVLTQILDTVSSDGAYVLDGDQSDKGLDHMTIAKKAMYRKKRSAEFPNFVPNPYFAGQKLARAAKKSPDNARRSPFFL